MINLKHMIIRQHYYPNNNPVDWGHKFDFTSPNKTDPVVEMMAGVHKTLEANNMVPKRRVYI